MPKQLEKIIVTHISLVKAGANGAEIIYKSAEGAPTHTKEVKLIKFDEKKGIVYGVVYAPDKVDSQGDFAKAEDIEKAAYNFMKQLNGLNVDKNHSFKNEDAFVAESWLIKDGDALFPDEPIGTWAVAIKLESESLKKDVASGEIAGLSMAGSAQKTEVKKSGDESSSFEKMTESILSTLKEMGAGFKKQSQGGAEIKSSKEFEKSLEAIKSTLEPLQKNIQVVTAQNSELVKQNASLKEEKETLEKRVSDLEESLKKSSQDETPASKKGVKKQDEGVFA